jgi:hypothetical protein
MRPLSFLACASVVALTACSRSAPWKLAVASDGNALSKGSPAAVQVEAGETTIIHLLVIGDAASEVTFGAERLPSFAMLQGAELRLTPLRQDAGQYSMTLTATDGTEQQSMDIDLRVHRTNTAPLFVHIEMIDASGIRTMFACPGPLTCTLQGEAKLFVHTCDAEGDAITVDVEVVPRGQAFTRAPNYSASVPAAPVTDPTYCGAHYDVTVPLPGLAVEQSYDFAVRVTDQFGAVAADSDPTDGWNRSSYFGFDQGPCTTRQCACLPSGTPYWCNVDATGCCSGACDTSPPTVARCR